MKAFNIEALFELLNTQLLTLCYRVELIDPEHILAKGSWYVSHIFEDEICVAMAVDYPDGPSMSFLPVALTDAGIEEHLEEVSRRKDLRNASKINQADLSKAKRREEYLKLKEEFEGE